MNFWLVVALAFATSSVYALLLSTDLGRRLAIAKTHYTVIVGVAMTIGFMALIDFEAAQTLAILFIATGTPIVIRSEWLDFQQRQALERLMSGGE